VGAWIRLHAGSETTSDELKQFAKGKIAHFKVPRYLWIVEEFPTTVTGKIQKYRIAEIVADQLKQSVEV
jgi:fatty-acyl-CoA synthase